MSPEKSELDFCQAGGLLARANVSVPDDPTVFASATNPQVGCNNLVCRVCGAKVRWQEGVFPTPEAKRRAAEVYAAKDWSKLSYLEPGPNGRLYACKCGLWYEVFTHLLEPAEPGDESLPTWRCAGHPRPSLPIVVDGVKIDAATDVGALVREVIEKKKAPEGASKTEKVFFGAWLGKLYERVARAKGGEKVAETLSRAVGEMIDTAKDPVSLAEVIGFFRQRPFAAGAEKLIDKFRASPATFVGVVVPEMTPPMLEDVLAWFASERVRAAGKLQKSLDAATIDLVAKGLVESELRFAKLGKAKGKDKNAAAETARRWRNVLVDIATADHGALEKRAVEIVKNAPALAKPILEAFAGVGAPKLPVIAEAIAAVPGIDAAQLRRFAGELGGTVKAAIMGVLDAGKKK